MLQKGLLLSCIFLCSTVHPVSEAGTSEAPSTASWLKTTVYVVGGSIGLIAAYNKYRDFSEKRTTQQFGQLILQGTTKNLLQTTKAVLKEDTLVLSDAGKRDPIFVRDFQNLQKKFNEAFCSETNRKALRKKPIANFNEQITINVLNKDGSIKAQCRKVFWPWGRSFLPGL